VLGYVIGQVSQTILLVGSLIGAVMAWL